MTVTQVMWFRRDLRLDDNPALLAAADAGDRVLGLYILDPVLMATGGPRAERIRASVAALREATGGALVVRTGDPVALVPQLAADVGARQVHIAAETRPYGRRRDEKVREALAHQDIELIATGSPYAVTPGRIRTGSGGPYKVFTPYRRAWAEHGWRRPPERRDITWHRGVDSEALTAETLTAESLTGASGSVGEEAAVQRWQRFLRDDLAGYAETRDRPDLDATSRLSVPLTYGEIHPRTLLADLAAHAERHSASSADVEKFVTELAWREFYADVLWHHPESAWQDLRPELSAMTYDADPDAVDAWQTGHTGFPFVDAGMRQLRAEGWMHNRVRMVVASFLIKDLHQWWPVGARHFLNHLLDGDLASNNHGWQWVAGTGTDAAPYFRVFNPITQGRRFDPDGQYVRRWIPELRHLPGAAAHEPWKHDDGYLHGYPARIVDHAAERRIALDRYAAART